MSKQNGHSKTWTGRNTSSATFKNNSGTIITVQPLLNPEGQVAALQLCFGNETEHTFLPLVERLLMTQYDSASSPSTLTYFKPYSDPTQYVQDMQTINSTLPGIGFHKTENLVNTEHAAGSGI